MSKENNNFHQVEEKDRKLQVGDLLQSKYDRKTKYYISAIARYENEVYSCFVLYMNGNKEVVGYWLDKDCSEINHCQYVGHSKANITDIFETEDNPHGLYCNTCGKSVFDDPLDYYMLKDKVWKEICDKGILSPHRIICKKCGEKFLGRKFTPEDMTDAPVNYFYNDDGTRILKILKR